MQNPIAHPGHCELTANTGSEYFPQYQSPGRRSLALCNYHYFPPPSVGMCQRSYPNTPTCPRQLRSSCASPLLPLPLPRACSRSTKDDHLSSERKHIPLLPLA
eukprot:scaffold124517_cov31-Tisochrysis_lutea.AAC.1